VKKVKGAVALTGVETGCSSTFLRPLSPETDIAQNLTHGWCSARPTVTFSIQHCHCPLAGTHFPSSWG